MPELLNITSYQSAIKRFIVGHTFKLTRLFPVIGIQQKFDT